MDQAENIKRIDLRTYLETDKQIQTNEINKEINEMRWREKERKNVNGRDAKEGRESRDVMKRRNQGGGEENRRKGIRGEG